MHSKDKLELPFMLVELCKYQQRIIDAYKDYVERNIHKEIKEEIIDKKCTDINGWGHYKKISIPQVTVMIDCSEDILKEWELLKHELPLIDLNLFMSIINKSRKELIKECQN